MKRGELRWVEFGDTNGGKIRKRRPAVIVSNNASNRHLNRVQVVPVSSNSKRVYPSEALIKVNKATNKAMADQLTTVSKQRLGKLIGRVTSDGMAMIEVAIQIQLGLALNSRAD